MPTKSQTKLGIWGRRGRQTSKTQRQAKLSSTATHLHLVESLPDPSLYEQERSRHTSRQKTDRQRHTERSLHRAVNLIFKGGVERGVSGWGAAAAAVAALGACGICKIGEREIVGLLDCWAFGVLQ